MIDRTVAEYYRDSAVRARLLEYCGDDGDGTTSAAFVSGFDPNGPPYQTWESAPALPSEQLPWLCERGCDVARSLWDTKALVFLVDLDYLNVDCPGEPFTHPTDVFFKLEATYGACLRTFHHLGVEPLTSATGRGYHFTGRIPLDDRVVDRLAGLATLPSWYGGGQRRRASGVTAEMSARQATAAAGLGLILEYLAQLVVRDAERLSLLPVVLNGTVVGSGFIGRECVSVDISHAGDPLDVRHVRMSFSAYQWHRARPDIFGLDVAARPPIATVPRDQVQLETFLRAGRDLNRALDLARSARNVLPDVSRGIERAIDRYQYSPIAAFHADFAAERDDRDRRRRPLPEQPPDVPPCVLRALVQPNDLLLKPEFLQHLVRALMTRGWSAAAIAELVQREYDRDHGWGDRWTRLDARTRADFDVRVFAGLIVTGTDRLIDFNCLSSQEKGICPRTGCPHNLRDDQDALRARFVS